MTTKSTLSYAKRAQISSNAVVQKLFEIAESKKSNVVLSADIRNTKDLLSLADRKSFIPDNFPVHPSSQSQDS